MNPQTTLPRPDFHPKLERIVSGGQTGADRAALDWAILRGFAHGGWCPRGQLAEDGLIPERFHLIETPSCDYGERTRWNVRDSDATVLFSIQPTLAGGSLKTVEFARELGRPGLHLSGRCGVPAGIMALHRFVRENTVKVLNVAGPRASEEPEVGEFVVAVLEGVFREEHR